MKYSHLLLSLLFFACSTPKENPETALAEKSTSPFISYTFEEDKITVGLEDATYTWLSMDSLSAIDILQLFQENYPGEWKKRLSEDLVEYLNALDIYPQKQETFTLRNSAGETITKTLAFTRANRNKAKAYFETHVEREFDPDQIVTQEEVIEDLDQLQHLLLRKYSYYFRNDVDIEKEIQVLKAQLSSPLTAYAFAAEVNKLINKFGDGHSLVRNVSFKEEGSLPFSTQPFQDEVLCIEKKELMDKEHPFLHSINGYSPAQLLSVSSEYLTPNASPQFSKLVSTNRLNRIGFILKKLGNQENTLKIILKNQQGNTTAFEKEMRMPAKLSMLEQVLLFRKEESRNPFVYRQIEDIGYLKISRMASLDDPEFFQDAIDKLKGSGSIIIDVRNNGGGRRDILVQLAPHFIPSSQGYIIGNLARLRTDDPEKFKSLKDRDLSQPQEEHVSAAAQNRMTTFLSGFNPSVILEERKYSPYYFLYLEAREEAWFADIPTVCPNERRMLLSY